MHGTKHQTSAYCLLLIGRGTWPAIGWGIYSPNTPTRAMSFLDGGGFIASGESSPEAKKRALLRP